MIPAADKCHCVRRQAQAAGGRGRGSSRQETHAPEEITLKKPWQGPWVSIGLAAGEQSRTRQGTPAFRTGPAVDGLRQSLETALPSTRPTSLARTSETQGQPASLTRQQLVHDQQTPMAGFDNTPWAMTPWRDALPLCERTSLPPSHRGCLCDFLRVR